MSGSRGASSGGARSRQGKLAVNGLTHDGVADLQRARILLAMTEVCVERGVSDVTVAHVVARAGVSRRTFYEQFADREECFSTALEDGLERASGRVLGAYDNREKWIDRIRASLTALLLFFEEEPTTARLLIVESAGAGARALERRRQVLAPIVAAVDAGRAESETGADLPPVTAEGIVGGVLSVLHARLLDEKPCRLTALIGPLMSMIVLPYLGPAAARRELARPVPESPPSSHRANGGNPLGQLEVRLTYRTVRVLLAVAASPNASNRAVAERAGIGDQGQISKLLSRLERRGLVVNTGLGRGNGAPNAWVLTQHGQEVHSALASWS
jgi:AcrR family transcriptional regulator